MTNKLVCWKCGAPLPPLDYQKLSFRAVCEKCDTDLHVCLNCVYYCPGKPNDCLVPGTDYVADRARANFCEDFKLKGEQLTTRGPTKEEIARRLFHTDE